MAGVVKSITCSSGRVTAATGGLVNYADMQSVTDARLLGRSAGSAGSVQEITVGAGLSLSGGSLSAPTYAQGSLLGRGATSGTGIAEVLTVGTGLSLSGTTLNCTVVSPTLTGGTLSGRGAGTGSGAPVEIALGAGLSMVGTTLYADVGSVSSTSTVSLSSSLGVVTASVVANSIGFSHLATSSTNRLIGRATAGSGNYESITVGTGLAFSGTTLNVDFTAYSPPTYTASKILGRGSASGTGVPEEITVGTGLSLSGTSLSCTITQYTAPTYAQGKLLGRGSASGTGIAEVLTVGTGLSLTGTTLSCTITQYTEPTWTPGLYGVLLGRNQANPTGVAESIYLNPIYGNYVNGAGYLEAKTNKSLTKDAGGAGIELVGDSATPGNSQFYGTNGSGTKGWYSQYASPTYAQGKLLGRGSASGTGIAEVLTVGSGLSLSGTTLSVGTVTYDLGGTGITTYAKGDLIHASATNTLAKLAIGSTGQVATVVSGDIAWSDPVTSTTGNATLSGDYTVTGSWGDVGISLSIPSAGTWLITYQPHTLAQTSSSTGAIDVRLYDVTNSAAISNSDRRVYTVGASFQRGQVALSHIVTTAGAVTIRLEAQRVTVSGTPVWTNSIIYASYTRMDYVRLK